MIGRFTTRNSSAMREVGASGVTKPSVFRRGRLISTERVSGLIGGAGSCRARPRE